MPTSGETIIGMRTLTTTPDQCTDVADASAAPTMPPISACEEEDGSPKYQVVTFQTMAPTSAAPTTAKPCEECGVSMMPLATVTATPVPARAPMRFMIAASASAPPSD